MPQGPVNKQKYGETSMFKKEGLVIESQTCSIEKEWTQTNLKI